MTDELPNRRVSSDGESGWFAYRPCEGRIEEDDEPWQPPREGSVIRPMGQDLEAWGVAWGTYPGPQRWYADSGDATRRHIPLVRFLATLLPEPQALEAARRSAR